MVPELKAAGPQNARDLIVTGRVQGVGYRPFVYRTAHLLGLTGTVLNGSGKVYIHAQGPATALDRLEQALVKSAPPLARPVLERVVSGDWQDMDTFTILASEASGQSEIHLPPDLFTCDDCVAELTTPSERRHAYPFINCTQCGPRYTIITAMPYDRPNTSMADFPLCDDCRAEYESPLDRRFHAQPLACQVCGPRLEFISAEVSPSGGNAAAIEGVTAALERGEIVAVKGVGGYHLICDANSDTAIRRLRQRKMRPHKPLAVMFPWLGSDGLGGLREHVELDEVVAQAVLDPARPIVLARKREPFDLSPSLAPGLRELGVFLPYSPLHHQLLRQYGRPIVATSGNISGEPVITANKEAAQRLGGIADCFLHHNRPIVRPADDPVVRPVAGRARTLRLGRGLAPLERPLPASLEVPTLAVGGHMKVTVALAWNDRLVISPHIGDLDSPRSLAVFRTVIADLQDLYDVKCRQIVCDLHPGFSGSRWAQQQDLPVLPVQHHVAHASSLAGEHVDIERWLIFTWDGVGLGNDGTLWGGEAFLGHPGHWQRAASWRPFRLPGGDKAGREPWRSAAALAWEQGLDWRPGIAGAGLAYEAWAKNIGVFSSSAVGRLFDAAAALVLGREQASFEGQGPMELEQMATGGSTPVHLPLAPDADGIFRSDWAPLLALLMDSGLSAGERAYAFHAAMARVVVDQALKIRENAPVEVVGLSGGVFQNRLLSELVCEGLQQWGFEVRLHREVPANDGGLCFGQVMEALAHSARRVEVC